MQFNFLLRALVIGSTAWLVVACTTPPTGPGVAAPKVHFPDIAIPSNTFLNLDDSVVVGDGSNWTGRLLATSELEPAQASEYIRRQMLAKGWKLLSSAYVDKFTYVFSNQNRIMSIDVLERGIFRSGSDLVYLSSNLADRRAMDGFAK